MQVEFDDDVLAGWTCPSQQVALMQLIKISHDQLVTNFKVRRRRGYLFGSSSITYNYTNDKIKQISRATLPENPEVNHAGHLNIQFLDYHETTTTTTILLKSSLKHHIVNSASSKVDIFGEWYAQRTSNLSLPWSRFSLDVSGSNNFSVCCVLFRHSIATWLLNFR